MTPGGGLLLAAAGLVAGSVNAVAGGGSLLTFPALLAAGHGALAANVTNTVGLVPGYLGAAIGYRQQLAEQPRRLAGLAPPLLLGAAGGCALLLLSSANAFRVLVPYLLAAACLMFAAGPRLGRWLRRGERRPHPVLLVAGMVVAGGYASYFGAAVSVLLLALLVLLVDDTLQRLNAAKSALSLAASMVGAVVYLAVAPVDLAAAGILAVSSLVGGRFGAGLARRLPEPALRLVVLVVGVAVAVVLLVTG